MTALDQGATTTTMELSCETPIKQLIEATTLMGNDLIEKAATGEDEPPESPLVGSPLSPTSSPWSVNCTGLKVLFLSSDTGGGHRASAESLGNQFKRLFPGSEFIMVDIVEETGPAPYNDLKSYYKYLSAHPNQWNLVYKVSNTTLYSTMQDVHFKLVSERPTRKRFQQINPDVVVSVHPLMNAVPVLSCRKISAKSGKHVPIFTVVTDLGSAHSSWFDRGVEKLFIASDQIRHLAKTRGKVPDEKLIQAGLPIRHDFSVQAEQLGDRFSTQGRTYQTSVKASLELDTSKKTILVMGGGEGCGALSNIVNALYVECFHKGVDAQILVVCGRNEHLKSELDKRDWNAVLKRNAHQRINNSSCYYSKSKGTSSGSSSLFDTEGGGLSSYAAETLGCGNIQAVGCIEGGGVTNRLRRILSTSSMSKENPMVDTTTTSTYNVTGSMVDLMAAAAAGAPAQLEVSQSLDENALRNVASDKNEAVPPTTNAVDGVKEDEAAAAATTTQEAETAEAAATTIIPDKGNLSVVGLGFVTRMAEYMVAADVLVTKAGPGTIAEAASLSLPVMLTSFLPGQEEGNVDFVVDGKFGAFCSDRDPPTIAEEVVAWLLDEAKLKQLSTAAKAKGAPNAAADIVRVIGESALRWKEVNEERAAADVAAGISRNDTPSPEPRGGATFVREDTEEEEESKEQSPLQHES